MASFASGLARGIRNAQAMQEQKLAREEKDKMAKLQGQLVELQLKQAMKKQNIIDKLQPDASNANGLVPTPFQNAGQQPQTSEQKMQGLSIGDKLTLGMDPNKKSIAQQIMELQGVMPGLGGQNSNINTSLSVGPSGATVNLDPKRLIPREITNADGSKTTIMVDPFSNNGFQSAPATNELPIPVGDRTGFIDPKTFNTPSFEFTPKDINDGNVVQVTPKEKQSIRSAQTALGLFAGVKPLVDRVFKGIEPGIMRAIKSGKMKLEGMTQSNPDIQLYESRRLELLSFVRAAQGAGTITETDAKAAESALADMRLDKLFAAADTEDVAKRKMDLLEKALGRPVSNILGDDALKRMTGGFTADIPDNPEELPDEDLKALLTNILEGLTSDAR